MNELTDGVCNLQLRFDDPPPLQVSAVRVTALTGPAPKNQNRQARRAQAAAKKARDRKLKKALAHLRGK